jgi:hypothetical protein
VLVTNKIIITILGIHYVPFRLKFSPFLFAQNISFSCGDATAPLTKSNYHVGITGKYQVLREIGFRAGGLYNNLNFNVNTGVDALFPSTVTNVGGYVGVTYGTVRNLIIGSTNLGMHKNRVVLQNVCYNNRDNLSKNAIKA